MSGRRGWRAVVVAAAVAAAATAGVAAVRRDLPGAQRPAPAPTRAPERTVAAAPAPGTTRAGRPAAVPEGPGPPRPPRWTARGDPARWEGPPSARGPLVAGDLVLAASGYREPGQVVAYDARTGRPRWRHRAGGVALLLAASPREVVVGSGRGQLVALEPGTGRRRWRVRLSPGQYPDTATVSGDRLYVGTSFPGEGDVRPPVVYALDARTGSRRWRAVLAPGTDLQWGAPVPARRLVLVASTPSDPGSAPGNTLHALDAATGRTRWEAALDAGGQGFHAERPLLHRGLVIAPAVGSLVAVDAASGRPVWRRRPGPDLPLLVGAAAGLVLAVAGDGLVALSVRDGRERWRRPLEAGEHRWVAMAGGTVHALAAGLAMAFDPVSGAERWRSLAGPAVGPPLLVAGRLYVATTGGLVALEAASGRVAWVGGRRRLSGGPLAAGGGLVAATGDGGLLGYAP